jgi:flagellar hook-basal body complex protein FliE
MTRIPVSLTPSHLSQPVRPTSARLQGALGQSGTNSGQVADTDRAGQSSFQNWLLDQVGEVNQLQHQAEFGIHQLLTGEDVNSAEVLTGVQKADMAFRLLVQIRNKLLQAYEELNAMRV